MTQLHRLDVLTPQEGKITVSWESDKPLTITSIDAGEFNNWFSFPIPPFPIQSILLDSTSVMPPAFAARSIGEIPYVLMPPPEFCNSNQGLIINCTERIFYTIPITILMKFEGVTYQNETQISVDLRVIPLDIASIQNLLIGTTIIVIALGGANFFRNKTKSGRKGSGRLVTPQNKKNRKSLKKRLGY